MYKDDDDVTYEYTEAATDSYGWKLTIKDPNDATTKSVALDLGNAEAITKA
jgi:hypothetical protein